MNISALPGTITHTLKRIHNESGPRNITLAWSLVFVFIGITVLSESNPLKLLIPGLAYPIPVNDARNDYLVYGTDRFTGASFKIERKILAADDESLFIQRIATILSTQPKISERSPSFEYEKLEPMPEYALAIRKVWVYTTGNTKEAIIDVRGETLDSISKKFLSDRTDEKKNNYYYMDAYFTSLTYSILQSMPEIKQVSYVVNGEKKDIQGMTFSLYRDYTHADLP